MSSRLTTHPAAMIACLLLAVVATLSGAHAAEPGFYVGGLYGTVSKDADIVAYDEFAQATYDFFGYVPDSTTTRLDDSDSGFGFLAGYRLLRNLALEGGYLDLGTVAYRAENTGSFPDTPSPLGLNVDSQASGIALSALGVLPISYRFEIYARGGVLLATNKIHTFAFTDNESASDEASDTSTNLLAGAGMSMSFLEIYGVRLEYMRIFDVGDEFTGEGDIDMISLGITVAF
jgi:OmpA-OmpF porin, OOP family